MLKKNSKKRTLKYMICIKTQKTLTHLECSNQIKKDSRNSWQ